MDFDLDQIEKEMDKMTKEMSLEEIAAMEAEIVEGFGQSFDEIFGADQPRFSYIIQTLKAIGAGPTKNSMITMPQLPQGIPGDLPLSH